MGPLKNRSKTVNNPNRKIGMLLGARAGDIIWYYKTNDKRKAGISINPQEIGVYKYRKMLMSTVNDALEILGYDAERIFNNNVGITRGEGGDKQ